MRTNRGVPNEQAEQHVRFFRLEPGDINSAQILRNDWPKLFTGDLVNHNERVSFEALAEN